MRFAGGLMDCSVYNFCLESRIFSQIHLMSASHIPQHVAIIMDGNGRWAKSRLRPRAEGHRQGVEALNRVVEAAAKTGIKRLTVFAFSSENWRRPEAEVSMLMKLFAHALRRWCEPLAKAGVRLRVIGDRTAFSDNVREAIAENEAATAGGTTMELVIAANYGGRWDCCQSAAECVKAGLEMTPENLGRFMSVPDVDLLIRTGGECRISNFLLWQSAYAEMYFTDALWPDFGEADLAEALRWYEGRERRFGRTSEQLQNGG